MTKKECCPNCKAENVEFLSTLVSCEVEGIPKRTWDWYFVDENTYKISYCPFCGFKLPSLQRMILTELGF